MKKLAIMMAVTAGVLTFKAADAQVGFHINLHFGGAPVVYSQPVPADDYAVYDNSDDDDYYYLPEVGAYYNVARNDYYYNNGEQWVCAAYLPGQYRNYNWRTARHYEIHEARPYLRDENYRREYSGNVQRSNWAYNDNRGGYNQNQYEQQRGHAYREGSDGYNNRGRYEEQRGDNANRTWGGNNQQQQNRNYGQQAYPQNGYNQNRGNDQRGNDQRGNDRGTYGQQGNSYGQYQNGGQQRDHNNGAQGYNNGVQGNNGGQDRGHGNNGGQYSQPSNQNRGNDRGNDNHFAATTIGVARPMR